MDKDGNVTWHEMYVDSKEDDLTHIEDGIAYLIDENFEKIKEIGEAEGVLWLGDFFMVRNGESRQLYPVDAD